MSTVYVSQHPLIQHKLTVLRRAETEPKKFRELVHELSQFLVYEATADLPLSPWAIQTPLGAYDGRKIGVQIGLVPILRAGLGMVDLAQPGSLDARTRLRVLSLERLGDDLRLLARPAQG